MRMRSKVRYRCTHLYHSAAHSIAKQEASIYIYIYIYVFHLTLLAPFFKFTYSSTVRDTQTGTTSFAARLAARIAAAKANHGLLERGLNTAVSSIERVTALESSMTAADDAVSSLAKSVPSKFQDSVDAVTEELTTTAESLHDELDDQLAKLKALMAAQNKEANDIIDDGLAAIKVQTDGVEDIVSDMEDDMKARKDCNGDGKIWHKEDDKCIKPALSADAAMDKVTHKMITGEDGREYGWINNRDITFTKHYDDTYVRVIYYDNMRVHGHTAHGMWELEFCDGAGGGCAQCNNPGRLMHWRWSGHQHGWWMNDHTGGTITGLCKSTNNRQLTKGDYQIKVFLRDNRYDLYTGANQLGSFMVDEVMKY